MTEPPGIASRVLDHWNLMPWTIGLEAQWVAVTPRFCEVALMALDPLMALDLGTVGYEPFQSNRDWDQQATNKASEISASHVGGVGALWRSLGATSWVIPG